MSQPAYFLSMTLAQVRCFGPEQTLDLRDADGRPARWTIILGENGVGKTTLLQCLCAIRPTVFPRLPGTLVGTVPHVSHWGIQFHELMHRVTSESEMSMEAECVVPDDPHSLTGVGQSMVFRHEITPHGGQGTQYSKADVSMFCCAYGASRRPGKGGLTGTDSTDPTLSLYREDAVLVNVEEWILQADYAARGSGSVKANARFDRVKDTLLQLLEQVDDLRVVGLEHAPPQPAVELHTPYGWVRPHQLSLGYRTLLAWVVDLAHQMFARYPDSEDPLAEPVVVLVDEIDLHLHPRWQRDLIGFLGQRFPNAQFIVTAHSPLVVQAAPDANLVVVRRENGDDHVTIHNDPAAVRGWRVDQILTSDLFGLASARPPEQERLLTRRTELLRNDRRTPDEEAELRTIDGALAKLPQGDSAHDVEAWEIIHRFAEHLRGHEDAAE